MKLNYYINARECQIVQLVKTLIFQVITSKGSDYKQRIAFNSAIKLGSQKFMKRAFFLLLKTTFSK